ncbi:MAG: metallophosphoesterase family protein [Syntrophales bacterium]
MRLIYAADIHGAFEKVKTLLCETVADVYIISGDLIDIPFYNMGMAIRYHELQTYFHGVRGRMGKIGMGIEDFVDELLDRSDTPDEMRRKGSTYQQYTIRARRVMQQKYKVLENIIALKQKSRVFCLPGNYDMDLKYTALHEQDLHLHWYQLGQLRIAGYGGADVWTAGIPERYIVNYRAGIGVDENHNEMYRFFKAVKPDIIVTHQPPYGIHDGVPSTGPSGSPTLRSFCDSNPVILSLSGHIHAACGFQVVDSTVYLNPSNFGEVTEITAEVNEGGFFTAIEIEEKRVVKVILKKIVDERIYDIADYFVRKGRWEEQIIDRERYGAFQRRENYDTHVTKYSHIPEITLYNEIKQFYRMFQTQETEERLDMLEQVALLMEDKIQDDIAMDVVGSVNVGLSEEGSDIDFVLYLRCDSSCAEGFSQCERYRRAEAMIREIVGARFKAEILDCVDLNLVEKSIREKNYECETTQRFVSYRSLCRPINYRVIAPIEDLLNQDMDYRQELEGSIRSYFKIFLTTSQQVRSFQKYEARLNEIGIKTPDFIRGKIRQYLQGSGGENKK